MRNLGLANGKPAVLVILYRQPGANIIDTVDRVTRAAARAAGLDSRRHRHHRGRWTAPTTIRASLRDVERTLLIAIVLVILVVFLFLRNGRATLIPSVAVPVSLIGTFGVMYLLGYSLDNLSLMALTIATGFVVDDAIVVLENITRHIEAGMPRCEAALQGAREVGFTVLSMSLSLIAVFIPDPADGRHRRPAVPRIRRHAVGRDPDLAGGVADHHADDVRASCCAREPASGSGRLYRCERARLRGACCDVYRRTLRLGAATIRCS